MLKIQTNFQRFNQCYVHKTLVYVHWARYVLFIFNFSFLSGCVYLKYPHVFLKKRSYLRGINAREESSQRSKKCISITLIKGKRTKTFSRYLLYERYEQINLS